MSETPPGRRGDAEIRQEVRERYAQIARGGGCCGGSSETSACCSGSSDCGDGSSTVLGYSSSELAMLPEGADLGLGCGNPSALLSLRPGETVLDLGSGAGIDCFLAAARVGPQGKVIGVDMTPEMIARARRSARRAGHTQVEFRLGEIEHLPVADHSVDVVLSNCVINLAPDKAQVYREAFRVLRPGGRLALSDVVATRPISARERADPSQWPSCSSGAIEAEQVRALLVAAGFTAVELHFRSASEPRASPAGPASLGVVAADILAQRPTEG
ncbi:MAG: arsenite methyltransferase [Thermoplasmata archaeon]|nr:arsenite methyltransferase [Thermoplasmata archaeon]MCI4337734.1 arsenite methyltransferase [Thermoplasmata archaeon]MCI4340876.1 arsenite methyltransferase [Thermoplasmata archaeon]